MKPKRLTPMLEQYLGIKKQYPDALLLYRMGDFYELFFEDAIKAAPLLEVQLTSRDKNAEDPIPMCGVPHHAAQNYIQKLIQHGQKIAICEQLEDPKQAKGVVKRDVVRVVTPALVGDPEMVSDSNRHILASVAEVDKGKIQVCLLDLFSGDVRLGTTDQFRTLLEIVSRTPPKELLFSSNLKKKKWFLNLRKVLTEAALSERDHFFEAKKRDIAYRAVLSYIKETQKVSELPYLKAPVPLFEANGVELDSTTIATLEILRTSKGQWDGPTLFNVLNRTFTPMGRRLLKEWLVNPLVKKAEIKSRQETVGNFHDDQALGKKISEHLRLVRDLERLTTKTALGLSNPRDLAAIKDILLLIPQLKAELRTAKARRLAKTKEALDPIKALANHLHRALGENPPAVYRDGGIFKDDYSEQIAEYRSLIRDTKTIIASIEQRERKATGIPSLKVKFNKVFGYMIEVTKTHLNRVPKDYIRKQTISTGERYITEELKEFERKVLTAEQKLKALEEELFLAIRKETASYANSLLNNATLIAELDVLLGFATAAREHNYVRPSLNSDWDLSVTDGRHPVVETLMERGKFVPNSVHFSKEDARTLIITGPNMAGKSTIMRQIALISLMAQAGSYVPAKKANLPIVDAIYTRIGSSDDLAGGRSTFMVEMTEVARILQFASPKSLILIDEIGRGTSTYDGLSLAWSLIEYIHTQIQAKTLFATHFHEITSLEKQLSGIRNLNVLVEKWEGEIVFLHRLAAGICNRSYGIEVAGLASVPQPVLNRAKEILGHLETQSQRSSQNRSHALRLRTNQMTFFE